MLTFNIVHEEPQSAVIFVQLYSFVLIFHCILKSELVAEYVPLQTLEQKHLSAPEHAAPTSIRRVAGTDQTLLQL